LLFPTATFALFFLAVLPASWVLMPRQRAWRPFMVAASYVFYGWWNWHYVFLLASSTLANQVFALGIDRRDDPRVRKGLLWAAVAFNLGLLGYFKYSGFFLSSTRNSLHDAGLDVALPVLTALLPIGISFYTFMALSYVIDIYRGKLSPTTLPKFAVFLSFFPHLVAGPIVRGSELIPQLDAPRDARRIDSTRAFFLIASGLFMKVVIASYLASEIVDGVFAAPEQYSSLDVLVGIYGYAVQIFADFLGYTNIAIGLALLLGYEFPTNFNAPYTATSVRDFWHRWHMTLSRWLRDYLYIPLGGSRGGRLATYRNLMIVMLLGGLWHGAAWTFVVWGGIHGIGLVTERAWHELRDRLGLPERPDTPTKRMWRRIVTFNFVCLGWVFFRSDSFGAAWDVLTQLVNGLGEPVQAVSLPVLAAIAVGIGAQYVPGRFWDGLMAVFSRRAVVVQGAVLALVLLVVNVLGPEGVAPFIYFRF
jgi:D-alanyl-lipoteichoic acid acyltransferase DltB (MBOAT superfamily)